MINWCMQVDSQMKLLQNSWSELLMLNILYLQMCHERCDVILLVSHFASRFELFGSLGLMQNTCCIYYTLVNIWQMLQSENNFLVLSWFWTHVAFMLLILMRWYFDADVSTWLSPFIMKPTQIHVFDHVATLTLIPQSAWGTKWEEMLEN